MGYSWGGWAATPSLTHCYLARRSERANLAFMTTTNDDFIALEMDNPTSRRAPEAPALNDAIDLDLTDSKAPKCLTCGYSDRPLSEQSICEVCYVAAPVEVETLIPSALSSIATESTSNASVAGIGSQRGPNATMQGVGFTTAAGYIQAIRNGVPIRTHNEYMTTLRTRFGMTSADLAGLPGPMEASVLPVGEGVRHVPTNHVAGTAGIFERPAGERGFKVGDAPAGYNEIKPADLKTGTLVAVARSEGNGVIIAWHGRHTIKRADLCAALDKVGAGEFAPRAASARAQAGHVVGALNNMGYVVRVERRPIPKAGETAPTYDARWTVGHVSHAESEIDGALGKRIMQITLTDDVLSFVGKEDLGRSIVDGYQTRLGEELHTSGDLTSWLGGLLKSKFDAVEFGALGFYVSPKHAQRAGEICGAVASTGFGSGWILPGLPVTTSDMLLDGILRGLTDEVDGLMERLATERATAKVARQNGDIGHKRAGTFLADLRKIGQRIAGYAVMLGDDRVAAAKESVRLAIADLEGVLADDHQGISARFAMVWDEIELDRKRNGGTL